MSVDDIGLVAGDRGTSGTKVHAHRNRLRGVAAGLVLALGGCSFVGVSGPGPRIAGMRQRPTCTTSRTLPAADTVGAAVTGLLAGVAIIFVATQDCDSSNENCYKSAGEVFALTFGVPAIAYIASAVYGFSATAACDDAELEYEHHPMSMTSPRLGSANSLCRPATIAGRPGTCDAGLTCLADMCVAPRASTNRPPTF